MSLTSSTNRASFGVTSATNFPFAFKIFDAADIVVTRTDSLGVSTTVSPGLYTVHGVGADTGSIDYPTHSATDLGLVILRVLDYTQPTVLRNQSTFYADVVEKAFDRVVMLVQQVYEILNRSLKVPVGSTVDPTLPAPVEGTVLGWVGGQLRNLPAATAQLAADLLSSAVGKGASLITYLAPYTGAVATTQAVVNNARLDAVAVFGMVGDGIFDNYSKLVLALAALKPGQTLYFPTPAQYYKFGTTLTVANAYVTLASDSKNSGLKFTGTGPAILVQNNFFAMRDILLAGTGGAYGAGASGTHGVKIQGAGNIGNFLFDNAAIQNFGGDGINMAGGVYTIALDKCTIQANAGNGIASTISGTDQNGNVLSIHACAIYGNGGSGVKWKASNLSIAGACVFEVNKGYGVDLTWGGVASSPLPAGFVIKGNYFENCLLGQIHLSGSGGVYVNGGEIEGNYFLQSDAAGGTGAATGPMGVAITATAFINAADSGYYGVRNVRIGKNRYSAFGSSLAYTYIDGGVASGVGAFDPTVIIEQVDTDDTRYVNIGDAQFKKTLKTTPISGKVHCTGFPWTTTDKSDDSYINGAKTGYFELPIKAGDALWKIDLLTQQASAQSYTVTISLETADSTTTTGYAAIGISQTTTNASGGTALNSLTFGSVMYRLANNYKVRLKVVITMGAVATTMYVFDPVITVI
jgi:hypothetical protein